MVESLSVHMTERIKERRNEGTKERALRPPSPPPLRPSVHLFFFLKITKGIGKIVLNPKRNKEGRLPVYQFCLHIQPQEFASLYTLTQ